MLGFLFLSLLSYGGQDSSIALEVAKENYYFSFLEAVQTHNLQKQNELLRSCESQEECAIQNNIRNQVFEELSGESVSAESQAVTQLPKPTQIKELVQFEPPLEKFANASYANKPRLFMFCRSNREYPCLMVIKDWQNNFYRENKKIWSQPSLALSKKGYAYNHASGSTPQGILQINGVMPVADRPTAFGKFRRMILNFIRPSSEESEYKKLLPQSHFNLDWWREAVVARDMGREMLRIHGTGVRNEYPNLPYFPFIPTSGCVAKRENDYNKVDFIDQRNLLDAMMKASGLEAKYENEPQIKALFYVINIDDKEEAVSLSDLKKLGIK